MARLAGGCTGHKWPAYPPKANRRCLAGTLHYRTWAVTLPHMARLRPAYLMRHGPFLACLVFSNEKAWGKVGFKKRYATLTWGNRSVKDSTNNIPVWHKGTHSYKHTDIRIPIHMYRDVARKIFEGFRKFFHRLTTYFYVFF